MAVIVKSKQLQEMQKRVDGFYKDYWRDDYGTLANLEETLRFAAYFALVVLDSPPNKE